MKSKKVISLLLTMVMVAGAAFGMTGCGSATSSSAGSSASGSDASASAEKVVIYCNSDDEAIEVMQKTLDDNGYEGKYEFQTFGTTELGGKMLAEGSDLEADMLAMSSYYIDSAQEQYDMFADLEVDAKSLTEYGAYYRPILANQGSLFYNTEELENEGLTAPTSLKDLANSEYKGMISVPDISGSSTAWLMVQALISEYGEDEAKTILKGIYENAGDNLESSGSGPIKKVLAGEVVIGFGLRHQAVKAKAEGDPIDYIDPAEGDFTLTEGLAVLKNDNSETEKLAQEMANCIITEGRAGLQEYYPIALYAGEITDQENLATNSKDFSEPLTVDLLEEHIALSEECK